MAIGNIEYTCTRLNGTNLKGILPKDEHGYYSICAGALRVFNSKGEYYTEEKVLELFDKSSDFQRQIERGVVIAEFKHPEYQKGWSVEEWLARVAFLDMNRECGHIQSVWLEYSDAIDPKTKQKVILIMIKVRPSGPFGKYLQDALDNPKRNVCFSVRCFTRTDHHGFVDVKTITNLFTFDFVNEPGLEVAEKFLTPGLEDYTHQDCVVTREIIERAIAGAKEGNLVSMESNTMANLGQLRETCVALADRYRADERDCPLLKW